MSNVCIILLLLRITTDALYSPGAMPHDFPWHNKTHIPGGLRERNTAHQAPTKSYNKDCQHNCLNRSHCIDLIVINTLLNLNLNLNHHSWCFSTLNISPSQLSHRYISPNTHPSSPICPRSTLTNHMPSTKCNHHQRTHVEKLEQPRSNTKGHMQKCKSNLGNKH